MPPEEDSRGSPQEWLRRARSNLARAKQPKPAEAVWEDLCFDAQQAVEKAFKAVLVFRGVEFPKTHNIRVLLALLDPTGQKVPQDLKKTVTLTTYATASRYPGEAEPVTEDEYREAVALAEQAVSWAEENLATGQQ